MVTQRRALVRATAAHEPRADAVEHKLRRFRPEVQPRVRHMAARHPWIADLAVSFPALLFALAFPRKRDDSIPLMVTGGAPLARLATELNVPQWMRAFPPEAFAAAIPALPDTPDFRRRIANHFPKHWKDAPRWMEHVANAARWGDDEIAIWFARETPLTERRVKYMRKRVDTKWRIVLLHAWFSSRPDTPARAAIETPWTPAMQWKAATDAAYAWRTKLTIPLYLGDGDVADMWLSPGAADGFAFTPIRTAAELEAESVAMNNCARTYAADIADNGYRLWSVRRNGARVATLSLIPAQRDAPLATIMELAGPANAAAPIEMWRAARRWLVAQDAAPLAFERLHRIDAAKFDAGVWRRLWRPFWLAKRTIPAWLPLTASNDAFYAL